MSVVATDLAGSQKMDLKWAPVWRAKCKENEGFQVSVVATDLAGSQKRDLKWAPVWRAKCKEFVR